MFTAEQARKIAKEKELNCLDRVLFEIKHKAECGNYEAYWYTPLSSTIMGDLKSRGFTISDTSKYDQTKIIISW